jgi:hypothetical protein
VNPQPPIDPPAPYPPHYGTVPHHAIVTVGVRQSGMATAALVLGLCTFITFGATGIPAVVLGILALRDIKARGVPGEGAAITGLVFGGLAVFGWVCWWGLLILGSVMTPQ